MAKASPMVRSFNAGEFSDLLAGRVDLDRYPSSMHSMVNFVAAPQGPAISRSGTQFMGPVSDNAQFSALLPFIFSNEQAVVLELAQDRIRFYTEDGLQVYAAVAATVTSNAGDPLKVDAATLAANVGDDVFLGGFAANYNTNGTVARVTSKVGTVYTLSVTHPDALVTAAVGTAARVYHVLCSYDEAQRKSVRYVQSVDVMYLLTPTAAPRKLSRYGDYDWRVETVEFEDGPFLPVNETTTTLTPTGTGNAVPNMTSNTAPSGVAAASTNRPTLTGTVVSPVEFLGRELTYSLGASASYLAFDGSTDTYWAGAVQQTGWVEYEPAAPFKADGYTIYAAKDNKDTSYASKDYAPSSWTFEGWNGSAWVVLDQQDDYVLYDGNKSVFFKIENDVAYQKYRLDINKLMRNGLIEARVQRLVIRSKTSADITINASAATGINNDVGFLATDVGRLLRLKGTDGAWRACRIKTRNSATQIVVELLGEPLVDLKPITQWRLGYWSDTTGWPAAGDFFEDRFWLAGSNEYPDMFAGSVTGAYDIFSQTDTFGEVLDDSAVVGRLNSRRLSRIRWLSSDARGLLLGTGSEEYTLSAPNSEALTARNIKARPATRRGSADVEPVRIDNQVLYVQRSGRTIREFAFVFEADGYKSPSMSQLASHLGAVPFAEMDYAAEPHSIVWVRRDDGALLGLTYNRDENVVGWHRHDLGGVVETLTVVPQKDQMQDALWVVVARDINGETRRYVERLTRFWDFDTTLAEAHFVDSALRYEGAPVTDVYGLQHLEGEDVYGLADERPVGPLTVEGGKVTLAYAAQNVILGLGYESVGIIPRLENGAADGTAQGKVKRINNVVVSLWNSFGGEIGVYNEQENGYVYEVLDYPGRMDEIEDVALFTGMVGPVNVAPGYDKDARLAFRRPKSSPLPFNIVAVMPQLNTQDR